MAPGTPTTQVWLYNNCSTFVAPFYWSDPQDYYDLAFGSADGTNADVGLDSPNQTSVGHGDGGEGGGAVSDASLEIHARSASVFLSLLPMSD